MSWYRRLYNMLRPERLSGELEREIAFHVAERADELMASGMAPEEARREARRRFGNPVLQKERTREQDILTWLESLLSDVRYAMRALRGSPGYALVAILSLGLGIGANTAIFSLIDAVLLRPLPVAAPAELLKVTMPGNKGFGGDVFTNPLWEQIRDRPGIFSHAFAFGSEPFDLSTGGEARRVEGSWVSGDYFAGLGVQPAAGRLLERGDDVRGCPPVAVLGYGFWQSEYGGRRGVVGSTIPIDGHPFEVIGVAARGFFGTEVGRSVQVYVPLCAEPVIHTDRSFLDARSTWFLNIMARPAAGLSAEAAAARLAAAAPSIFAATLPSDWKAAERTGYSKTKLSAVPAPSGLSWLRPAYRGALLTLMTVVGLVLLIACANVANLLLARSTARQRETAIRLAIGAGRARLMRQLLTESVLLSVFGAATGLLFARWGSALLVRFMSTRAETVSIDLSLDGRVLAFTIAVAIGTGLLFGIVPAFLATRSDPQAALKAGGRGVVEGRSRFALLRGLVVGQVALSLALVTAAGLLLGTFRTLTTMDPGFRREGVLLVSVDARNARFSPERQRGAYRELLDRLRGAPGVRSASASALTPLGGMRWNDAVVVDGYSASKVEDRVVWFNAVSDGYFRTLGTGLVAGRDLGRGDVAGSRKVAIINETMARRFFAGRNPVGQVLRFGMHAETADPVEIVGVVKDAKYGSLREDESATVYLPLTQSEDQGPFFSLELRADGSPTALIPAVKRAAAELSPAISLDFTTISTQLSESLARERLMATLSGFFGGLALLLAMIGVYGTMAYSVARRRSEIGVRVALGAARERVMGMVFGEVGRMVAIGVVVGAALALATTRWLASFLFGVRPTDPVTLLLSVLTLALVAIAAGALPAWRAARVDPTVALRED